MIETNLLLAAGALMLATVTVAGPTKAESFPPIKNQTVKTECGECHMAFFPEMLPRKSWVKILNDLGNHYGEDASIDPAPLKEIIAFHTSRASDVLKSRGARKWREGLKKDEAPDRITTAPRFIRKHKENDYKRMWTKFKVTSNADCVACHKDANKGLFDDD
ncbi:MAG: cytochrome C [bacterium]|nr:cytochrome C [bacterium]